MHTTSNKSTHRSQRQRQNHKRQNRHPPHTPRNLIRSPTLLHRSPRILQRRDIKQQANEHLRLLRELIAPPNLVVEDLDFAHEARAHGGGVVGAVDGGEEGVRGELLGEVFGGDEAPAGLGPERKEMVEGAGGGEVEGWREGGGEARCALEGREFCSFTFGMFGWRVGEGKLKGRGKDGHVPCLQDGSLLQRERRSS